MADQGNQQPYGAAPRQPSYTEGIYFDPFYVPAQPIGPAPYVGNQTIATLPLGGTASQFHHFNHPHAQNNGLLFGDFPGLGRDNHPRETGPYANQPPLNIASQRWLVQQGGPTHPVGPVPQIVYGAPVSFQAQPLLLVPQQTTYEQHSHLYNGPNQRFMLPPLHPQPQYVTHRMPVRSMQGYVPETRHAEFGNHFRRDGYDAGFGSFNIPHLQVQGHDPQLRTPGQLQIPNRLPERYQIPVQEHIPARSQVPLQRQPQTTTQLPSQTPLQESSQAQKLRKRQRASELQEVSQIEEPHQTQELGEPQIPVSTQPSEPSKPSQSQMAPLSKRRSQPKGSRETQKGGNTSLKSAPEKTTTPTETPGMTTKRRSNRKGQEVLTLPGKAQTAKKGTLPVEHVDETSIPVKSSENETQISISSKKGYEKGYKKRSTKDTETEPEQEPATSKYRGRKIPHKPSQDVVQTCQIEEANEESVQLPHEFSDVRVGAAQETADESWLAALIEADAPLPTEEETHEKGEPVLLYDNGDEPQMLAMLEEIQAKTVETEMETNPVNTLNEYDFQYADFGLDYPNLTDDVFRFDPFKDRSSCLYEPDPYEEIQQIFANRPREEFSGHFECAVENGLQTGHQYVADFGDFADLPPPAYARGPFKRDGVDCFMGVADPTMPNITHYKNNVPETVVSQSFEKEVSAEIEEEVNAEIEEEVSAEIDDFLIMAEDSDLDYEWMGMDALIDDIFEGNI